VRVFLPQLGLLFDPAFSWKVEHEWLEDAGFAVLRERPTGCQLLVRVAEESGLTDATLHEHLAEEHGRAESEDFETWAVPLLTVASSSDIAFEGTRIRVSLATDGARVAGFAASDRVERLAEQAVVATPVRSIPFEGAPDRLEARGGRARVA
jgi:hypothetical protein